MSLYEYIRDLPEQKEVLEYANQDDAYNAGWKIREQLAESGEDQFVCVDVTYLRVRLSLKDFEPAEQEVAE